VIDEGLDVEDERSCACQVSGVASLSIRGADEAAPGRPSVGKRFKLRVGPLGLSTDPRCPPGPA
jgi:hypothetical protein